MKQYFAILLLLLVFGCKKDSGLQAKHIKGVVVHGLTFEPIPNQPVELTVYTRTNGRPTSEFPGGVTIVETVTYYSVSDADGHYSFDVGVPNLPWAYGVIATTGNYITTSGVARDRFLDDQPIDITTLGDTILVERSAFVKYSINIIGNVPDNEALYLHTPYNRQKIRPDNFYNGYLEYNYLFFGRTTTTILDTIPAETQPRPEVKWLRRQFDTIAYKVDTIQLEPMKTTNYTIQY